MKRWLAVLWLQACLLHMSVPDSTPLSCASNADCPAPRVCDLRQGLCVDQTSIDTTPPTLTAANALSPEEILLTFDEQLGPTGPSALGNYTFAPPLPLLGAALSADAQTITLSVSNQQDGALYTVTVTGLVDLAGNAIAPPDNQASFTGRGVTPDATPPVPLLPTDATRIFSPQVDLHWTARTGVHSYGVDIALGADFTLPIPGSPFAVTPSIPGSAPDTKLTVLFPAAGDYIWRVHSDLSVDPPPSATLSIIGTVLYVYCPSSAVSCSDSNSTGNADRPYQTIGQALADAKVHGITRVEVADRGSGIPYEESLVLQSGVSIYGGYGSDFSQAGHDSGSYMTAVHSAGPITVYGQDIDAPTTVDTVLVSGGSAPTVHTVELLRATELTFSHVDIDGGSPTSESMALEVVDSPANSATGPMLTLSFCSLRSADGALNTYALNATNSDFAVLSSTLTSGTPLPSPPSLTDTTYGINGGNHYSVVADSSVTSPSAPTGSRLSYGVLSYSGVMKRSTIVADIAISGGNNPGPTLVNNDIRAGACGVCQSGSLTLVNNTISGTPGRQSAAIIMGYIGASNVIANNIFFMRGAPSGQIDVCMYAQTNPTYLQSNLFFDCPTALITFNELAPSGVTGIADTMGLNGPSNYPSPVPTILAGNFTDPSAEASFVDFAGGDLHLATGASGPIVFGGINAATGRYGNVIDDHDGKPRTCSAPTGGVCYGVGAYAK